MYALLGAPQAAVNQLELARRANDGDFYTMSEIDARMRDLHAEVKRDRKVSGRFHAASPMSARGVSSAHPYNPGRALLSMRLVAASLSNEIRELNR